MVYSQSPIPFSRGTAKSRVFLHNIVPNILEPFVDDSRTALVFDGLREQIASGANIDDVLNSAASAAQDLTAATGAAIAMRRHGTVVCVGRSGEAAPELGARVSVDSGISGECVRSGKVLICDDTQLDSRVDADVCMRLGLRSVAAVPLQTSTELVGLLEVFSNYPANFSKEHVAILKGVAELVESAQSRVSAQDAPLEAAEEASTQVSATAEDSLAEPRTIDWLRDSQETVGGRRFPYWTVPVVLTLTLLAFRGWMAWYEPGKVSVTPSQAVAQDVPVQTGATAKLNPARNAPRRRVLQSAVSETPDVVVRNFNDPPSPNDTADTREAPAEDSIEPPQLPVLSSNGDALLGDLVAKQATMPKVALKVSQGVVRGTVVHRVPPTYPADALSQGLSGPVVLRATIDESGNVEQVKAVSGSSVLARAAIEAVKQWRYEPSLLNGTPVRVETEITVNFKKP